MTRTWRGAWLLVLGWLLTSAGAAEPQFRFGAALDREPSLGVAGVVVDGTRVTVNGGDSRRPSVPFTFDWGDGQRTEAWFPATHTYADSSRNYAVEVTAHYGAERDTASVRVRFVAPNRAVAREPGVPRMVRVARAALTLESTMPGYRPPTLAGFADAELAVPRELLEYVLDIAHSIQLDLCNGDIDPVAGPDQVVLKAADFGGAFSLWLTKPMSLGANPGYLADLGGLSPLFHEMGHNLTLNCPARYRFGGKIDGPMNTIVSETLAQVMQHTPAWLMLNKPGGYGLPPDFLAELRRSAFGALGLMVRAKREYVAGGCRFHTVQDQAPGQSDASFNTFMTTAWVFVMLADKQGEFRAPAKRLMARLGTFCEADHQRFQQRANETFRASFMAAALSDAFRQDLRPQLQRLGFPLDDAVYAEVLGR